MIGERRRRLAGGLARRAGRRRWCARRSPATRAAGLALGPYPAAPRAGQPARRRRRHGPGRFRRAARRAAAADGRGRRRARAGAGRRYRQLHPGADRRGARRLCRHRRHHRHLPGDRGSRAAPARTRSGRSAQVICAAFRATSAGALTQLDRALVLRRAMPRIDMLLAQRYAGAAGKARARGDDRVGRRRRDDALALRAGDRRRASSRRRACWTSAAPRYAYIAATAPMLGLACARRRGRRAAGAGILSSAAMVDLYSQIYADEDIDGDWARRAAASCATPMSRASPAARLAAMRELWGGGDDPADRYSRQVLTAYAAARLPVDETLRDDAADIIASMLAAGLDRNALRWAGAGGSRQPGLGAARARRPRARSAGRTSARSTTSSTTTAATTSASRASCSPGWPGSGGSRCRPPAALRGRSRRSTSPARPAGPG